jgi:2-hydroxy-3-oxopropionate reductase
MTAAEVETGDVHHCPPHRVTLSAASASPDADVQVVGEDVRADVDQRSRVVIRLARRGVLRLSARVVRKVGYDVIGYNRSPAKVEKLVEQGGRGTETIADAVHDADVIVTMLPDSPDVEQVVSGEGGVLEHATSGALWIDASTIRPDVTVRMAAAAADKGIRAVDAPVSGGEAGAVEGSPSIMVGGAAADVEAAHPILEAMGTTDVGPAGSGQTVKAANQLIVAGTIELVAEALVLLDAHGVDAEAAVKVLAGGLAGNRILDRKAAGMIAGDCTPGFRVDLHHKDLGIVTAAARGPASPSRSGQS